MKKTNTLFSIVFSILLVFSLAIPTNFVGADNTGYEPENPGIKPEQTAEGEHGMVVSAHPLASEIGADVLKNGGNAVDAAVAMQFALNVVEPMMSGIGGGGFLMYYDAEKEDISVINSRERAPAGATPDMFMDKSSIVDGEGKFMLGVNELNNDGGGQFHFGEIQVNDLDSDEVVFSYDFEGEGENWDPEKFDVFEKGTTLTLDEEGGSVNFGADRSDGDKRSFAQATSTMEDMEESELLVKFKTDTPGNDRRIRLWLKADDFRSQSTTYVNNGYGIEIDTSTNEVKVIQSKDAKTSTLESYKADKSTDWQWVRFQVDEDLLKVRTWLDDEEEPEQWDEEVVPGSVIPFSERVQSGTSVGVPGTLKGLETATNDWGTMPLEDLISPAIDLAEEGFQVNWALASAIESNAEKLSRTDAKDVFLNDDGEPLEEGDLLVQEDLAKTFKLIQEQGTDVFYDGEVGEALADVVQEKGGSMTQDDLTNYDITYQNPVSDHYRGYEIASMPPPSSGGLTAIQILKMYDKMDLSQYDVKSAEKYHHMAEATRLAYADRGAYMGDPEYVDVPSEGLLNSDYIDERVETIDPNESNSEVKPGNPWEYQDTDNTTDVVSEVPEDDKVDGETTHFTVADRWGNMVSYTTTIEQVFGSGIMVPDYGIMLNNELTDFDATPGGANQVEPNKTPLSSMSPTIVLKDGKPYMTVGSPGGTTIITSVAQTILNVIGYDMDLKDAIEEPRIFTSSYPDIRWEYGVPDDVRDELAGMGHVWEDTPKEIGNVNSILLDAESDLFIGAADSTREGTAIGLSADDFLDTSEQLEKMINEIKAEELDESNYTEESWQALQTALTIGEELLKFNDIDESVIEKALNNLELAYDELTEK